MVLKWHFFRIICALQLVCALYFAMDAFASFLNSGRFMSAVALLSMLLVGALAGLGISLLSRNYPAAPVEGKQKKTFNRLFLVNILLLALLFAKMFSLLSGLRKLGSYADTNWYNFSWQFTYPFYLSVFVLLAQFIILFGLYFLRRELYDNFTRKKFEFENSEGS